MKILESRDPNLSEAKKILKRITKRELYRCVIKITTKDGSDLQEVHEDEILEEIRGYVGQAQVASLTPDEMDQLPIKKDEIIIVKRKIDMGMGKINPVKKVKHNLIFLKKLIQSIKV